MDGGEEAGEGFNGFVCSDLQENLDTLGLEVDKLTRTRMGKK